MPVKGQMLKHWHMFGQAKDVIGDQLFTWADYY